jgi:NTE family protein
MPFGSEGMEHGIGLALSGGGFRAVLFHLGAIWRLNELGVLARLNRISSVSGGSITNGVLATRWPQLAFDANGVAGNLITLIVDPLRAFCAKDIDKWAIAKGALNPFRTAGEYVAEAYRDDLGLGVSLRQLPTDTPRFVFNSTNLQTGATFRFSKPYCGDYRLGLIRQHEFDVATAVACSSAFPPVLSPVRLEVNPALYERTTGADLFDNVKFRSNLTLSDGGVYDNMGTETIWNRYDTVLVSDAGKPFEADENVPGLWPQQLARVLDITMNQALALRKRALINDFIRKERGGSYWGIKSPIREYPLTDPMPVSESKVLALADLRTRLSKFSEREQCELINWGYAIADAAMRSYPVGTGAIRQPQSPYPAYALDN